MRFPRSLPLAIAVTIGLWGAAPLQGQQARAADILGRWEGTSTCVKAAWKAACNDETVVYQFEPSTLHPGQIALHASKVINGAPEPMYDLDFVFDSAAHMWAGDFDNARVSIRWSYQVLGDDLSGKVVFRKTGQVGRNVTAHRRQPPGT